MQIKENVWLLKSSKAIGHMPGFHCYLVKDAEGLTLIDTSLPGRGEQILREIEELGFQVSDLKRILLTHGDMDHIGNAPMLQKITGCHVYASEAEICLIKGEQKRAPMKEEMFRKSGFVPPEVLPLPQELAEYRVIATPGHTVGHVCYLFEDVLFAGDACSTEHGTLEGPDPKFTENMELAARSWEEAQKEAATWICPAHGMPIETEK